MTDMQNFKELNRQVMTRCHSTFNAMQNCDMWNIFGVFAAHDEEIEVQLNYCRYRGSQQE